MINYEILIDFFLKINKKFLILNVLNKNQVLVSFKLQILQAALIQLIFVEITLQSIKIIEISSQHSVLGKMCWSLATFPMFQILSCEMSLMKGIVCIKNVLNHFFTQRSFFINIHDLFIIIIDSIGNLYLHWLLMSFLFFFFSDSVLLLIIFSCVVLA